MLFVSFCILHFAFCILHFRHRSSVICHRSWKVFMAKPLTQAEVDSWRVPIPGGAAILAPLDRIVQWGRKSSMWSLTFGLSCCAIEMMATAAPRYDLDRFGMIFRATPRQADGMIVAGGVNVKMAPFINPLYDQL